MRITQILTFLLMLPTAAFAMDMELRTLPYQNMERSYYVFKPELLSAAKAPVLLALHGGGRADGKDLARRTGYNDVAKREGFIAVYPNGVDEQWNDGRGVSFRRNHDNSGIDDVGFLVAVIKDLEKKDPIDAKKIYMTGLSNGGMMTLRFACDRADLVAAIAPVIANLPKPLRDACNPMRPLPTLLMNGTDDPFVPWAGGDVQIFRKPLGKVLSTQETLLIFAKTNACGNQQQQQALPDLDQSDHSKVIVHRYQNCQAPLWLYEIQGGGHSFPAEGIINIRKIMGNKNKDISGPDVIWNFLSQHKLP